MVKQKIKGNVNFEIKSQFMRELRKDTFSGNKNKDAHDHVDRVFNIVSLFNISGVSQDAVLLRVFPFTLTGSAKRWVDRLPLGAVNTWDLLKKAFIQRYCPPSKTAKRLKDIHNFKQESDESLYQSWERNMSSSSDTDGLAAVISKLDNLGCDMKKLKENVHAIQVGCQICEGTHLDKECPPGYYSRTNNQTPSGEKKPNLVETINKYMEEATKRQAEQDEWLIFFSQNTKNSRIDHDKIIQKFISQVKTLVAEVETKVAQLEECKKIFANYGMPLYTPFYYSLEEIEYFYSNSGFSDDEKYETTKVKTSKAIPEWKSNLPEQTVNHYVEPYVPPYPFPNRLK
ncbi:protein kinase-like domain, concanavalin A-like lectin/glucanase domain protein [Tanacetum coccineum]